MMMTPMMNAASATLLPEILMGVLKQKVVLSRVVLDVLMVSFVKMDARRKL